jgi:hypothetical protein
MAVTALADDDHLNGYDAIVRDLSGDSTMQAPHSTDPFEAVQFHIGFGGAASHLKMNSVAGLPSNVNLNGYELDAGIDLLSPQWQAVGHIIAYNADDEGDTSINAKEFGLILQYKAAVQERLSFVLGAGLGARYLDLGGTIPNGANSNDTTPLSILTAGIDVAITPAVSIVLNASYKAALIRDTNDAGSIDGNIGVMGHF